MTKKVKYYHVGFYTEGHERCFDESYYSPTDLKEVGEACSYIGNLNVRVFIDYEDGSRDEIILKKVK